MPFNAVFSWLIGKRMERIDFYRNHPLEAQSVVFSFLIQRLAQTKLGKSYLISAETNPEQFSKQVPLSDYNSFKAAIDRSLNGENDLIWPKEIEWFAKSSGTSSGRAKLVPVTRSSLINNHYAGGKDLLAQYYQLLPGRKLYNAKHLIVGGSAQGEFSSNGKFVGDLSAIIIQNLPWWTELRRTPKREIALLENWEEKLEKMARSVIQEDVCIIAGIPSWTSVLLERVLAISGKNNIREVWPNLELYIHGGMNFAPYQNKFRQLISGEMNYIESYNSSEGYFGLQDQLNSKELLLLTDAEVYYEFIPMTDFQGIDSRNVIPLQDVKKGQEYALVITTSAGLWRYIIGDTIRFTSVKPYRFVVTGRTTQFINAFGEKLIVEHTEKAIAYVVESLRIHVRDYCLAPVFSDQNAVGFHEWVVELEEEVVDLDNFRQQFTENLDNALKKVNSDYEVKRSTGTNIDKPLVHFAEKGTFEKWLKSKGKLGGQHKVPRLLNDSETLKEILNV
ncbi:MAG: hypothetical protein RL264_1020 [Bacteroidota bacterium]|jgi:hypothetical protein